MSLEIVEYNQGDKVIKVDRPFQTRKIPLKSTSNRGFIPSLKPTSKIKILEYESQLEHDFLIILDHDPNCLDLQPQPDLGLTYKTTKNITAKITPDCWALFTNDRQYLFEIKPESQLQKLLNDENWKLRTEKIQTECEKRNFTYQNRYVDVNLICLEMKKILDKRIENDKIDNGVTKPISKEKQEFTNFLTDRELSSEISKLIQEAENSLLIATPWIDAITEVKNQLVNLRNEKKVDIDLLTRPGEQDSKHHKTIVELKRNRINIETDKLLHTKMIIKDETIMYLGSANLLVGSLEKNREAGIITNDPDIVKKGIDYFKDLFYTSEDSRLTL